MIKTLFFSLLSCSLLGFSFLQTDDPQLLRTPEGMIIIPSTANVSEEDAAEVLRLVSQESEPVAHFAYNINGESGIYGNFSMEELEETVQEFAPESASAKGIKLPKLPPIFGFLAFRKKRKCHQEYGDTKCKKHWVVDEDQYIATGKGRLMTNLQNVLDKYGYIEVDANPGE